MKKATSKKDVGQRAAMKAVAFAVQRVAEEHGTKTKDAYIRDFCYAFFKLAEGCVDCIENGQQFTIILQAQEYLPGFELSDEAYGVIE